MLGMCSDSLCECVRHDGCDWCVCWAYTHQCLCVCVLERVSVTAWTVHAGAGCAPVAYVFTTHLLTSLRACADLSGQVSGCTPGCLAP